MDGSDPSYPSHIPDYWAAAAAQQAAQQFAYDQLQAPFYEEPNAWQSWNDAHADAAAFTGMQNDHDFAANQTMQRTIEHDKPPVWDGDKPEKNARPYVKTLDLWLSTTRAPAKNH